MLLSDRIVMMTNGPAATIGEILDVNLERPRNRLEMTDNLQYNQYRHAVLKFLYEKQNKIRTVSSVKPDIKQSKKKSSSAA